MLLQRAKELLGVSGPGNDITKVTNPLRNKYQPREKVITSWYELLRQDDKLKQDKMESFVSNDPRTLYNMSNYLLQPRPMTFKIENNEGEALTPEAFEIAQVIQTFFTNKWRQINLDNAKRLRSSWFNQFIGMTIATGWYFVPNMVSQQEGMFVDYWNPSTVFPEPSDDPNEGMLKLARIRKLTGPQAEAIVEREGWKSPPGRASGKQEHQLWAKNQGSIFHGVSFDQHVVKEIDVVPGLTEIPVIAGVVGGLPDDGAIDTNYIATMGQSILATNEKLYANANKINTYLQQLMRDTANPRAYSRTAGRSINLKDTWYGRGALYELGLTEDIQVVPMPGIPIEIQSFLISMRSAQQRGGISDVVFGNIMQKMSSVIVAQAAESAMQLLLPYHDAIEYVVGEVTNNWYQVMLKNRNMLPTSLRETELPDSLLNTRIRANYQIKIPGDLQNRVNTARMMNPNFKVPLNTVMELVFPEIGNPAEAIAQVEGEAARQTPQYNIVRLILALRGSAARSDRNGDSESSRLFRSMADNLEREVSGRPTPGDRTVENVNLNGNPRQVGAIPSNIPSVVQQRTGGTT